MRVAPLALKLDYVTVFKYMKPPRPTAATWWWIFAVILGAALIFVLYELISRKVRKARRIRRSEEDFNQLTLVCRLTAEEIKLLRHLVGVCEIEAPARVFTSFELFNACLEEKSCDTSGPLSEVDVKKLRTIRNKIFFGERSRLTPIKSTRELKSNQWLHLRRISDGEVYMAPVVEAGSSGLLVATPQAGGEKLQIEPNERFAIYFWRDRDASYHFESEALGQTGLRVLITTFKHVDNVERVQRRQYHRVTTSIPVSAIPVTRQELDKVSQGEKVDAKGHPGLRAYVTDMSGNGFALAARSSLSINDLVYLELPSDREESTIPVIGKILGVSERETTDEALMHAEFVGLSGDTQEKIFGLIYSQAGGRPSPVG